MNEEFYIYYVVPNYYDNLQEQDGNEKTSQGLQNETSNVIQSYFPYIILIILFLILYSIVKR